jgi:hypothetical protein
MLFLRALHVFGVGKSVLTAANASAQPLVSDKEGRHGFAGAER